MRLLTDMTLAITVSVIAIHSRVYRSCCSVRADCIVEEIVHILLC